MRAAPVRRIALVHCLLLVALVVLVLSIPAWAEPIADIRYTPHQDRPSGRMLDPQGEDRARPAGRDAACRPRFAGGVGSVALSGPQTLAEGTDDAPNRLERVLGDDLLDVEPGYLSPGRGRAGEVGISSTPNVLAWGLAGDRDDSSDALPKSSAVASRAGGGFRQLAFALLDDLKTPIEDLADGDRRVPALEGPRPSGSGAVQATFGNPLPVPILWAILAAGMVGMLARRLRMI